MSILTGCPPSSSPGGKARRKDAPDSITQARRGKPTDEFRFQGLGSLMKVLSQEMAILKKQKRLDDDDDDDDDDDNDNNGGRKPMT